MRFTLQVTDGGKEWSEEYDLSDVNDAQKWAKKTVKEFNETLQPGERARKILVVQVIDADTTPDHKWEKTNLYTLRTAGIPYDAYKCLRCGITGKRFTLDGGVARDRQFAAKVYARCDTTQQHLERKRRGEQA